MARNKRIIAQNGKQASASKTFAYVGICLRFPHSGDWVVKMLTALSVVRCCLRFFKAVALLFFLQFVSVFLYGHALLSETEHLLKVKGINREEKGKYDLIENLKQQIKTQEDELRKEEVMNKNFERLLQLISILGQIDTFLSERTRSVIKKLAALTREEEELYKNNID